MKKCSSILRFAEMLEAFAGHRRSGGWTDDDILEAVDALLGGENPLEIEAEIEAGINRTVTWSNCPKCGIPLTDSDKSAGCGVCSKCSNANGNNFNSKRRDAEGHLCGGDGGERPERQSAEGEGRQGRRGKKRGRRRQCCDPGVS